MAKKFNNMKLLYVFAALLIVFGIVEWYQKKHTESTLNTNIVQIDTAKVTKVLLYPTSEKSVEIEFRKDGKSWKVIKGKIIAEPAQNMPQALLMMLMEIKIQRLASKDKAKWSEFQVTDTTATKVKVYEGNKLALDLLIGKFTYQRTNNPYGGMNGGGGISGTSYIRLAGEEEIYAIEGFLTFSFNQGFNVFRNQSLAKFDKPNVEKITFKYPGDSSFTLTLSEKKKWIIGNEHTDSAKVSDYLNALANKSGQSFDDNFIASGAPAFEVIVEGKNMKEVTIDGYQKSNDVYVINSNLNPKSYFSSATKGIFSDIFKGKGSFFVKKKN